MTFVTVESHLLNVFDISNLTQCPIHHPGHLHFNVALLFRYSKPESKYCIQNAVQSAMEDYAV